VLRYRSSQCTIQDTSDSILNAISQIRHTTVDLNDLTAVPYLNRYWLMLRYVHIFTRYNTLKAGSSIINTH